MVESIRNVGEFEGVKAMMNTCRCALTRALLWPVHTSLKHGILTSKLDYRVLMLPKELPWFGEFYSSHCNKIINFKNSQFTLTGAPRQRPRSGYKKGTLRGGTPHPRIGGISQKYFGVFPRKELVDGP
jgi:hypothetical protein